MDRVISLCEKYGIVCKHENIRCRASGIGDILFYLVCLKNRIVSDDFYMNLSKFTVPYYGTDPIKQLEFRINLIQDIIKCNEIDPNRIHFVFSNDFIANQDFPYDAITNFNLSIESRNDFGSYCLNSLHDLLSRSFREYQKSDYLTSGEEEYVILHTKCRHRSWEDYSLLKLKIANFCKTAKFNYKIIILGERSFPMTEEVEAHGITTVYNELLNLKIHNVIVDNTIEDIYNNLNYENYKADVSLIRNAKYNICFGVGGQFCSSVIFGKSTIIYCNVNQILNTEHFNKNNYYCTDIESFFNVINEKCCA